MNPFLRSAWASLRRCHLLGALTVESVFKLHRHNTQFNWIELIKDVLSIVGTVIVTNTCMVAPDDEMSTAVVLADQGVENCFSWTGVAHVGWINCQNHSLFREVVLHHNLVAAHPHICCYVILFGRTNQWMEEQTIDSF